MMATKQAKTAEVNQAQRRVDTAEKKRDAAKAEQAKWQDLYEKAVKHLNWVRSMPVDDDEATDE